MAMTIEFRIKGVAAIYRNGDFWQVVFICDQDHKANFKHEGTTNWSPLHKKNIRRDITVHADNIATDGPTTGPNYQQILNLADSRMHGKGKLKVKKTGQTDIVSMLIPAAEVDGEEPTRVPYYVVEENHGPLYNIGSVSQCIQVIIQLNSGAGMRMMINDQDGETTLLSVPFSDNTNYLVEFDNDCGQTCKKKNDFLLYYDWFKDTDNENKRFLAGRILGPLANKENFETKTFEEVFEILSPENGNCDPVKISPPPNIPIEP